MGILHEEFPARSNDFSEDQLLRKIRFEVARARESYGIMETDAVTKFVYLSWLLGEDFDAIPQHDWIQNILFHDRPGSERLEIIMAGVIHHLDNKTELLRFVEEYNDDQACET